MNGFVAFLDIVGFSKLIEFDNFANKFNKYLEIIERELEGIEEDVSYITSSDSLILNTKTDSKDQLFLIADAVSKLSYSLLYEMALPLCGCISVGNFSLMKIKGNVMMAGSPIIDAVDFEKKQDWIGIMLSPIILKKFPDCQFWTYINPDMGPSDNMNQFRWASVIQRYSKIPLNGLEYDGFTIVPHKSSSTKVDQYLKDLIVYTMKLDELKLGAPSVNTQMKYIQATDFLDYVHDKWISITNNPDWGKLVESMGDVNHFKS